MVRNLSRRHALASGLSLSALSLSALAACAPVGRREKVRIGYQKQGVLLLAKARGGLEAALAPLGRTSVEWVEFVAGPPLLEAMRAGAIDIGAVGDTPPIFAQAAGADIAYVAAVPNADAAEALIVPATSPLKGLEGIRGARVGFTKNSSSNLLVLEALRSIGLSLADIHPAPLAPPDAAAAFANGAIDAWAIWDPYLALAQARSPTRTLIDRGGLAPSSSFILAHKSFAQSTPHLLAAVLDCLAQESAWGDAHVEEAARIIAGATGITGDVTLTALRRAPCALTPLKPEIIARQQAAADLFNQVGLITKPIAIQDAVWSGWRGPI